MNDTNLDSPEVTIGRAEIIQNKPFLRKVYLDFYKEIKKRLRGVPKGKIVELGSGGGFIKEVIPSTTTSDIMELPNCDLIFSAEKMPFKNNSISAFVMLNVFHHIKNSKKALNEFQRCLKKGGRVVMVEPFNSPIAKFVYKYFHHETFDPSGSWIIKERGDLSGANGSLAWIVFKRDVKKFGKLYPHLSLQSFQPHTPFSYLLSGGFTLPSLLPSFLYPFIAWTEMILSPLNKYLGLFCTVTLKKI